MDILGLIASHVGAGVGGFLLGLYKDIILVALRIKVAREDKQKYAITDSLVGERAQLIKLIYSNLLHLRATLTYICNAFPEDSDKPNTITVPAMGIQKLLELHNSALECRSAIAGNEYLITKERDELLIILDCINNSYEYCIRKAPSVFAPVFLKIDYISGLYHIKVGDNELVRIIVTDTDLIALSDKLINSLSKEVHF